MVGFSESEKFKNLYFFIDKLFLLKINFMQIN